MEKEEFNNLVLHGFDVEFNYKDIFYMISTYESNGKTYISLANNNCWHTDFDNIEDLDNFILIDKSVLEIISELPEEEIYY